MNEMLVCDLAVSFQGLDDPRIDRTKKYPLIELVFLTIVASLCGANSWQGVILVGEVKLEWLRRFFKYENGIPSHDTVGRVFSLIDPKKFHNCFIEWTKKITAVTNGEIVAIDGKQSRCSHDSNSDKDAIHLVNAPGVKNGLSLGQIKVSDKSNEITAIPQLLELLEIKGAIVTIDAMGCQKNIAATIIDNKADYVLALKGNQTSLHKEVQTYFEAKQLELQENTSDLSFLETVEKEHGRIETRSYFQIILDNRVMEWVPSLKDWKGVQSLIIVKSRREVGEKISSESRYHISSLPLNVKVAAEAVRGHWGVENGLHWVLDVVFDDDKSRIRKDYAPQNFNLIKKLTINALKQESTRKSLSLANKRALAAMDNRYLEKLIAGLS